MAANNKGADQTVRRMRRLICAFVVHIWHDTFSHDLAHILCDFLASKGSPFQNLSSLQLVLTTCVAAIKSSFTSSEQIIFSGPLGSMSSFWLIRIYSTA